MTSKHPPGLRTLFFTEMWERLSYYGMRGLLVLYMTKSAELGGLGIPDGTAAAIYGLYTAAVYLAALPGGWIADRVLGPQRSVWYGGIVIALGHFTLAIPRQDTFFVGLVMVALGSGLLKTSMSTLVGMLYPEGGARRDAGFSLFYMGVNLGAFLGPFVCSWLGEKVDWHLGFAAAGVGMLLGLFQYRITRHRLGDCGLLPHYSTHPARDRVMLGVGFSTIIGIALLALSGAVAVHPEALAQHTKWLILGLALLWFVWALALAGLNSEEKKRMLVIAVLFVCSAMFWAGFEQVGSSLNLFADRFTIRRVFGTDWEFPAGWFLMVNAGLIILLAPAAAMLWVRLAKAGRNPSLITKMAMGLLLLAAGFAVIALGSQRALAQGQVWPTWLFATYFLHTVGELCLSPVGLSAVTKLAPPRLVGQAMGIWFLGTSLGNLLAGLFAGEVTGENTATMPQTFMGVVWIAGAAGLLLLVVSKPLGRLCKGIE